MRGLRGTARLRLGVAMLVLVVMVLVAVSVLDRTPKGLRGAIDLAADEGRFESGREAGATFARIATLMRDDAIACGRRSSDTAPPCVARGQAFALAQTSAVAVTSCTQPGIHDHRVTTLAYLRRVEKVDGKPGARVPPFPALPRC